MESRKMRKILLIIEAVIGILLLIIAATFFLVKNQDLNTSLRLNTFAVIISPLSPSTSRLILFYTLAYDSLQQNFYSTMQFWFLVLLPSFLYLSLRLYLAFRGERSKGYSTIGRTPERTPASIKSERLLRNTNNDKKNRRIIWLIPILSAFMICFYIYMINLYNRLIFSRPNLLPEYFGVIVWSFILILSIYASLRIRSGKKASLEAV